MYEVNSLEEAECLSLEDMKRILKHLPNPSEVTLEPVNFDYTQTKKQADRYAIQLGLNLESRFYGLENAVKLSDPTNQDILSIYEEQLRNQALYRRNWSEAVFLGFKKAFWYDGEEGQRHNLKIELHSDGVYVETSLPDFPSYIKEMISEIYGTGINYDARLAPSI